MTDVDCKSLREAQAKYTERLNVKLAEVTEEFTQAFQQAAAESPCDPGEDDTLTLITTTVCYMLARRDLARELADD